MIVYLCVYCERSESDLLDEGQLVAGEEPFEWVSVSGHRVQLCHECRMRFAAESHIAELMKGPVDFPPGVRAVEHCCPQLLDQGFLEEDATRVLILLPEGRYMTASCEHCGISVRSLVDEGLE